MDLDIKAIKEQAEFILKLAEKLNERTSKIPDNTTCYIRGYTRITNDIVRVRAELNDLKGMIKEEKTS